MQKVALSVGLVFAALVMPGVTAPTVAQEATVRYSGELTGSCTNFRNRTMQVDVQGTKISGVVLREGGDIRFGGELKGATFVAAARSQTPAEVRGTIEGDVIRATFSRQECTFKAVLKKQA